MNRVSARLRRALGAPERFVRVYRWCFNIPRWRWYRRLVAERSTRPSDNRSVVVFDFKNSRIDGPMGRRFYTLFMYFLRAGYTAAFTKRYLFLATLPEKTKRFCLEEPFYLLNGSGGLPADCVVVTDRLKPRRWQADAAKTVVVDFRPGFVTDGEGFPMPFPMHPMIYAQGGDLTVAPLRATSRRWRIFFGGNLDPRTYARSVNRDVYGKLPRARVIEVLRDHLGPERWMEPVNQPEFERLLDRDWDGALVLNRRRASVQPADWLPTMARASFFLAGPGVRYPLSHNVIEAMAVGTIPIIEYPELFFPSLEDGVNCLTFEGESGLRSAVDRALNLSSEETGRMSKGASEYYDRYVEPGAVVRRLLDLPGPRVSLRLLPFLKLGGGYA